MAKGGVKKAAAAAARAAANRLMADNRQAPHQYEILETLEARIDLVGTEVKSISNGKANLRSGFCLIRNAGLQLHNVHISPHSHASAYFSHDTLRTRKLLAHLREIDKLRRHLDKKGFALILLNIHLKGSWIKLTTRANQSLNLHAQKALGQSSSRIKNLNRNILRFYD